MIHTRHLAFQLDISTIDITSSWNNFHWLIASIHSHPVQIHRAICIILYIFIYSLNVCGMQMTSRYSLVCDTYFTLYVNVKSIFSLDKIVYLFLEIFNSQHRHCRLLNIHRTTFICFIVILVIYIQYIHCVESI